MNGDVGLADGRLAALLAAWPPAIPLVMELQDPSWHVDETFEALRAVGAVLCTTELPPEGDEGARATRPAGETGPEREPPMIRRTGSFLYLRLRRHDYDAAGLDAWAARIEPFLVAGDDVYVVLPPRPCRSRRRAGARLRATRQRRRPWSKGRVYRRPVVAAGRRIETCSS